MRQLLEIDSKSNFNSKSKMSGDNWKYVGIGLEFILKAILAICIGVWVMIAISVAICGIIDAIQKLGWQTVVVDILKCVAIISGILVFLNYIGHLVSYFGN